MLVPAVAEAGVGPALLGLPAGPLALLPDIATPAADTLVLARIAGAALLAIGAVCALACRDPGSPALLGVLSGILVYDVLAALLLIHVGLGVQMNGPALWPAVVLHTVLAVWCLVCLPSAMRGVRPGSRAG